MSLLRASVLVFLWLSPCLVDASPKSLRKVDGILSTDANSTDAVVDAKPARLSLFCFVWSARTPKEEALKVEARKQLAKCDGHIIFNDPRAAREKDAGMVDVEVPEQEQAPGEAKPFQAPWLFHGNMKGLMPAWTHLLDMHVEDSYDWLINLELDHIISPRQVKLDIAAYLNNLRGGTLQEKRDVRKAMMLMWGNAFLFNRKMVKEMRRQWPTLRRTLDMKSGAPGCPAWMLHKPWEAYCPPECSQDMVYPVMVKVMKPPIAAYGIPGCGQFVNNGRGKPLPFTCWDMCQAPNGCDTEEVQLDNIRAIARGTKPTLALAAHSNSTTQQQFLLHERLHERVMWENFLPGKDIALIHHANYPSVHKLAMETFLKL